MMMRFYRHNVIAGFALTVAAGLLLFFSGPGSAMETDSAPKPIRVQVRETSQVDSAAITLGQVARVEAGGFLQQSLEGLELGKAPKPGKVKAFTRSRIESVLRSEQFISDQVTLNCPDRIYVKRPGQSLTRDTVRAWVEDRLSARFEGKEYEITDFKVRGLDLYPRGELTLTPDPSQMTDARGRLAFFLNIAVDGARVARLAVRGRVALYEPVFFLSRALKKGDAVTRQDVMAQRQNVFDLSSGYITRFERIAGKVLRTGLRKGACLKPDQFGLPVLVKKGSRVTLVARNQNLLIITAGLSKEDGSKDSLVRVENLASGRQVRGIVTDLSRVEVVY